MRFRACWGVFLKVRGWLNYSTQTLLVTTIHYPVGSLNLKRLCVLEVRVKFLWKVVGIRVSGIQEHQSVWEEPSDA